MVLLHLAIVYHLGGLCHHATNVVKIAYASEQVETVGVECLDLYEVGGIANELQQPALEFCSGGARER